MHEGSYQKQQGKQLNWQTLGEKSKGQIRSKMASHGCTDFRTSHINIAILFPSPLFNIQFLLKCSFY